MSQQRKDQAPAGGSVDANANTGDKNSLDSSSDSYLDPMRICILWLYMDIYVDM